MKNTPSQSQETEGTLSHPTSYGLAAAHRAEIILQN